jgi:hypothetical protein
MSKEKKEVNGQFKYEQDRKRYLAIGSKVQRGSWAPFMSLRMSLYLIMLYLHT